jgi:hypothetical protein
LHRRRSIRQWRAVGCGAAAEDTFIMPLAYRCHVLASVVLATLLAGCISIKGMPEPPATSTAVAPEPGYQLGADAIRLYNAETDTAKKLARRNDIIDARMAEIDRRFAEFERALYAEGIGVGIGTDWALLALTAASTLSTVSSTQTIFSAVATAVVGGTAAYDKRVLFDKTLPSLMAQMVAQRETQRVAIRTSSQLPVESYTLFAAESDLQAFARAGSIPGAIASVAQDAGQKTAAAQQEMRALTRGVFERTASGTLLRDFWKPDGVMNKDNEKKILDWLGKNGFDTRPGAITMFLSIQGLEAFRARAAAELGLR